MPKSKKTFNPSAVQSADARRQDPVYPKPDVPVAPNGFLSPKTVTAEGLKVVVFYEPMRAGDVIALRFNGDDTFVPIKVENQTPVSFLVPVPHIIRALGTTVDIQYTLGGTSAGQKSDILQLTVLPFMEGDLEMATVKQATPPAPGLLDLNTFPGDADIEVNPWPLIVAGQTVWLDLVYQDEESSKVMSIIDGEKVSATEASTGMKRLIDRDELKKAVNESMMEFPLSVNFSGSDNRNEAKAFTTLKLIYRQEGQTGGVQLTENFEKLPSGQKPSPFVTDYMTFTGPGISLKNNPDTNNMYLNNYGDAQKSMDIAFHTPCSKVSFSIQQNKPGTIMWCYYGNNAQEERAITASGTVSFSLPNIKSIKVKRTYEGQYYLDNFKMTTELMPNKLNALDRNSLRHSESAYPQPVVLQASGDILSPMKVTSAGLEVTVSYLSMKPGHVIALKFNGDDRLVPIEAGTGTSVSFRVPVSYVAAALGQTIPVQYTVGGTGGGASSEILQLSILPFMEGDLPMSEIIGAKPPTPGELDLGIVAGDPVFRIPPWPLISAGQTVWLDLKYSSPSSALYPVIVGKEVTTTEASEGITHPVPRDELKRVTNGSLIGLQFKVNFSGAALPDTAVSFPTLKLLVQQEGQGGVELTQDFASFSLGTRPSPFPTPTLTLSLDRGTMEIRDYGGKRALAISFAPTPSSFTIPLPANCSKVTLSLNAPWTVSINCKYGDNKSENRTVASSAYEETTFIYQDIKTITLSLPSEITIACFLGYISFTTEKNRGV